MYHLFFEALGTALVPAFVGYLIARYAGSSAGPKPAPIDFGGWRFYLSVWGVSFLAVVAFNALMSVLPFPQEYVAAVADLIAPALCAGYYAKRQLISSAQRQ